MAGALPSGLSAFLSKARPWARGTPPPATDPLTRLPGAVAFHAALEAERERLARTRGRAGLLVVDLDGFKVVNDEVGHALGDRVLAETARRLQDVLGNSGIVARVGGDEFSVLARRVTTQAALGALADELRVAVTSEPVVIGSRACTVVATVGATLFDGSTGPAEALRLADEQMYLAKRVSGSDPFDRVSELVVGLLETRESGLEAAFATGIAEIARAGATFVDLGDEERWWPEQREGEPGAALRELARRAKERDEVVEDGEWRLAAPLRGDGRALGAFAVERGYPFGKADRIALARAGLALGQALLRLRESVAARRRISELETLAFRDENTGLPNRRALLAELARLEPSPGPLSLLFLDFDGLRAVNNELSYERGNDLLRAVTAAIETTLRPGELAARLHGSGGDEFIVVCPGVDEETARLRAARLERVLGRLRLPPDIGRLYGGASVGHALRADGEPALEFVERAASLMRSRKALRKAELAVSAK
jgi:diguanylate cyclase (GGDEF)-like protein